MKKPAVSQQVSMQNKLAYVKNNWQLYVIFMLPAFLLTLVFKYFPVPEVQ